VVELTVDDDDDRAAADPDVLLSFSGGVGGFRSLEEYVIDLAGQGLLKLAGETGFIRR
jgi:hypothetical protein